MPFEEKKAFIHDPRPDMTMEQKNMCLSAESAVAPYVNMKIVRIERIEIGAQGWWIHHRIGGP